jgi:ADP-ribose pyrophosphatase YjhB (NUDIX family)
MPPVRLIKHSHCSYCGAAYAPEQPWPRVCTVCGQTTFQNPIPVTIVLQPVDQGVLVVRRAIDPQRGTLALPGGYIDLGETWQQAGAREVWEEAQVRIDPAALEVARVFSAPDGTLIVAALAAPLSTGDLPPFTPNAEAEARAVLTEPAPLAWPLHTELVADYLAGRFNKHG